ncbi:replication protein A 70 kDa DNA-binding subunit C [Trifolium repens]|nr:replication protein A 70 kDa DNA-binding subunit C [Trifolium repens]
MFTSYFGRIALHGIDVDSNVHLIENRCVKHIFQVVPRFKVKIEVSDGDYTAGFILFDSDMSYLMEKSCAYFVAQTKATSQIIDVDSDEIADDVDFVTSHAEVQKIDTKESVPMTMMRNFNDSFNVVAQVEGKKRLRKIKIEKE